MAIKPRGPESAFPIPGLPGNKVDNSNNKGLKENETDPTVKAQLAAEKAAKLQAQIEKSEQKRVKVSKLRQLVGLFNAYAPKSTNKLKEQTYDDVDNITKNLSTADEDALRRYEETMNAKLKLVESEQAADILREVERLNELQQQRPELVAFDRLTASKKQLVEDILDGSETGRRELNQSMIAAANLLQERTQNIPESKTVIESVKDTMISIRVELGKKFQNWKQTDIENYLINAYQGNIEKVQEQLQQSISIEEIELLTSDNANEAESSKLKVKEVLAPRSRVDMAEQMRALGDEALNAVVETYQPATDESFSSRKAIAKQKVQYRFNQALDFDTENNNINSFVVNEEEIDSLVENTYAETGLDPDKVPDTSLRKQKIEIEREATAEALKRRMRAMNNQREVYLEAAFASSDELENITPNLTHMPDEEQNKINSNLEKLSNLTAEQRAAAETAGTIALRDYLLEQGLNKKKQLLEEKGFEHSVDDVLTELRSKSLEEVTIEFTNDGIAVLRFSNIEDLSKFDQTIDKDGKLVYQKYTFDKETQENPENQHFILGTAFVKEGFFATYSGDNPILDAHEHAHLMKEFDRQVKVDVIQNRTEKLIAEYLIKNSNDSSFDFNTIDPEKMQEHVGFVLRGENIDNAREWGFSYELLQNINELIDKGEKGLLEGNDAKMYRSFNRLKRVSEAMLIETKQKSESEEFGTSLMTMPLDKGQILTLANAGIFREGEKAFDGTKESHLASLALVRYLNTLNDNNNDLFADKQFRIAQMILRRDKLTLHSVAEIIQEIESNEFFEGLAPERTETFLDEAEQYTSEEDNNVKMTEFFKAHGYEGGPANISLSAEEFNLLYRLFILPGGKAEFNPLDYEITALLNHEFDETPNYSNHSFMRQYFADSKKGILNRDQHKVSLLPLWVTNGAPWPLRTFGIPGTGPKGFETIGHFLPGPIRNFFFGGRLEDLEKLDPDKIIPFGLSDHPKVKGFADKLATFDARGDENDPTSLNAKEKRLRQLGVFERYILGVQVTRGTIVNTLNVTNNQADLALTKIGGIEVDWYRGQQSFNIEDLNKEDEYRNNASLKAYISSRGYGKDANQREKVAVAGGEKITRLDGSIEDYGNRKISKGTITNGLLEDMLATMYVDPANRTKGEEVRAEVVKIGKAVMEADRKAYREGGNNYTVVDLIKEIKRIDLIGPTNPDYPSNPRRFVEINGDKYEVEDARVFIQQFYMGRAHRVTHTGMYHSEEVEFRKENDNSTKYKRELKQTRDGLVIFDPFNPTRPISVPDPKNFNPNDLWVDTSTLPPEYGYLGSVLGTLGPNQRETIQIYNDDEIRIVNNVTGHTTEINSLKGLNAQESIDMFGEFFESDGVDGDYKTALNKNVIKGIPYLTADSLKDRHDGIDLYWHFLQRYYQAEQAQRVSDLGEKMWGFWTHIDKVTRWTLVAIALVSIMNPALFGVVSLNYLLGTAAYSFTAAPFFTKMAKDSGAKKKAAEGAMQSLFSKHNMFFEASQKQLSTSELLLMKSYIKALKGEVKGLSKVAAENLEWGSSNKTQGLIGDIMSGTGSLFS